MQIADIQQLGSAVFFVSFAGDILSFILVTALILVMHFLMPQAVLEKYFKPPFFSQLECKLFTGIPYAPLRTIMFMRAIAYPNSGRRRGIKGAHLLVPRWYAVTSKLIVVVLIAFAAILLIQVVGLGLLSYLVKNAA